MTPERKSQIRTAMEDALSVLDDIHDAALEELQQGARDGTYRGDPYDAPDDCESVITVKHGDLRKARRVLREALSGYPRIPDGVDVRDALADMTGLVQLIASRPDLPADIKAAMLENHRYQTAKLLVNN